MSDDWVPVKDCRNCMYYNHKEDTCYNYLCRNQSEYDEFPKKESDIS